MSGSDKILSHKYLTSISAHVILSTNRGTLIMYIAQTVYVLYHCKTLQFNCSIDVTVDDLDRFDLFLFFCFFLRLIICPVVNFVFLHRDENSYLLFHPRFA